MRILLIIMLFTLYSCGFGNKESETQYNTPETSNATKTETTTAIEKEEWNNWQAPPSLDGYALDALVIDPYKNAGLYSALAVYKKGAVVFRVQIVDGSTDKGKSEMRDHLNIATQNLNSESEYGYEKTLEHNGIKTKEEFLKMAGEYMIKFLYKEKYGVSVKSNAESAETIWKLIGQLNLDELK